MGDSIVFSPALLAIIRSRRIDSKCTPSTNSTYNSRICGDQQTRSDNHSSSSFSNCSGPSACHVCLPSLQSSDISRKPSTESRVSTFTKSTHGSKCSCSCFRCSYNRKYSRLYGITLCCSYSGLVLDDDLYLQNGFRVMAPETKLLMSERYVIQHYLQSNCAMWNKTDSDIRRETLRKRSYLEELELFSPIVTESGTVVCSTCNQLDDGLPQSCVCRRIFLTQSSETLDFSTESLIRAWIYYHHDKINCPVFIQQPVRQIQAFSVPQYQLPSRSFEVDLLTSAYQHLSAYWLNTTRPPEIQFQNTVDICPTSVG